MNKLKRFGLVSLFELHTKFHGLFNAKAIVVEE